jgi:hypothetical protein
MTVLAANLKSISKRRLLFVVTGMVVFGVLSVSGIYAYHSYADLPESLVFRRTARHSCIKCGSQGLSHMTTIFDGFLLNTAQPTVIQSPAPEEIDPLRCEHVFVIIAANDRYIDFSSLRVKRWAFGKVEGESFWSEPSLVRAFASLSRSNLQDSSELFSYLLSLRNRGKVTGKLLEAVTGTNIDQVIPLLHQAYTNSGNVLISQRRGKP